MKIACLLVALMAMIISGCGQTPHAEPNENDVGFDKELDEFYRKAVGSGGYSLGGTGRDGMKTITEIANIKLSYANYKSSQKLQRAIDEFNRSSTALANKMLYLTILIAVLTSLMALLTAVQVANSISRFAVWMRKIMATLRQSYIQRFAKAKQTGGS